MKNMYLRLLFVLSIISFISATGRSQATDSLKNAVSIYYNYHHFDKQFKDDWHITSLEYKRQTQIGAVLGRINYASRLGRKGVQYELDAYPKISEKVYLYASLGYSNKVPVFAKWRSGLSIYLSLPKDWEAEGGYRQLYFDKNIWIGTVGLSKYVGNWLLNARTFFRPSEEGSDQSYFLSARRYLKNEKDYVWLQAGRGVSPDETRNVQINTNPTLASTKVQAGIYFSLTQRNHLLFSAGWSRDEFLPDTYGNQYFGSIGFTRQF